VGHVALALVVILAVARLGGHLAVRLGQSAVLGELVGGVLVGNLSLLGFSGLDSFKTDASIDMLSRIGALILLFEVGLESTVGQMLRVGASALLVATLGVAAPFALGWGVGAWLLPEQGSYVHALLGATLTATSVGITARVLKDLGRSQSNEARIVLGAAVIDDVRGLVILAVVTGVITAADRGGSLPPGALFSSSPRRRASWSAPSCWELSFRGAFSLWRRNSVYAACYSPRGCRSASSFLGYLA
jgi:Kef-type K+ transport system membrane component KefB